VLSVKYRVFPADEELRFWKTVAPNTVEEAPDGAKLTVFVPEAVKPVVPALFVQLPFTVSVPAAALRFPEAVMLRVLSTTGPPLLRVIEEPAPKLRL